MPWISTVTYDLIKPKIESFIALLHSKSITNISIVGFCWGSWCAFKTIAEFPNAIKAAAIVHPAVHLEQYAYNGDIEALSKKIHVPTLVLPAGNDPDIYRAGGVIVDTLKANNPKSSWTDEFKDMTHGFVPRGDIADSNVDAKVKLAMQQVADFIIANA